MASGNILKAVIDVSAPGAEKAFTSVAVASQKTEGALRRLSPAANQATGAMINLGRVVQDAPFGFLGIANNLNPLLESFQRLKATTGTTGGALKALGSSLLGAGGLGFALSIVSSLLLVFGTNLFGAKKKAEDAEPTLTSLQKATKKLHEEIEQSSRAVVSNAGKFKDLQTILVDVSNEYLFLTDAIVKQGLAQLLFTQKEGIIKDLLTKAVENQLKVQKVLNDAKAKEFKIATDLSNVKPLRLASDKEFFSLREHLDGTGKALFDLNTLAASLGLNFSQFIKRSKDGAKDTAFEFDHLKQIFIDLVAISKVFADQLSADIKLRLNIQTEIGKGAGSAFDKFTKEIPAVSSELQRAVDSYTKNNPILIEYNANIKRAKDLEAQIKKDLDSVNNLITSGISDAFVGFGEGLGAALSGGGIGKAFQSFVSLIGSGVQAIGKQLIILGTTALLAKQALTKLFSNPGIMIAAGIALVAVGAALKSILSGGVKGFAGGGFTGAGGRNDPAGIVHKGEFVIPAFAVQKLGLGFLNQLAFGGNIRGFQNGGAVSGVAGGGALQVQGQFVLRGNDLIALIANTGRSQGRLT